MEQVGDLLWHSSRTRKRTAVHGVNWESRIAPSAGGCHPIYIALLRVPQVPGSALVYDGQHHVCGILNSRRVLLKDCLSDIANCLPYRRGTILLFLADMQWISASYSNPESLVWRDSGALSTTIGFVAEAMGLEFCILGVQEPRHLRRALGLPEFVRGVGGCIVSGGSYL